MVRAGVVKHPSEWPHAGFNKIQPPPRRYQLIEQEKLSQLLGMTSMTELKEKHLSWVDEALLKNKLSRDEK